LSRINVFIVISVNVSFSHGLHRQTQTSELLIPLETNETETFEEVVVESSDDTVFPSVKFMDVVMNETSVLIVGSISVVIGVDPEATT